MVGCTPPRRKRRAVEDLGGRVRARRRSTKVQSAASWREPERLGPRQLREAPLPRADGLGGPVLAAEQLGLIRELAAQAYELREDHHALCDCLCAAGVLTPGEIDLQRQLRARAARLRCICASPALVGRIASFTASGAFAAASAAAAMAVRATLLMTGGPDLGPGGPPARAGMPPLRLPQQDEWRERSQLDGSGKEQTPGQLGPALPSQRELPPQVGFTTGLFRRLFMTSEAQPADASRAVGSSSDPTAPSVVEAPPGSPSPEAEPEDVAACADSHNDVAAGPESTDIAQSSADCGSTAVTPPEMPETLAEAAGQVPPPPPAPTGAASRFFGGFFTSTGSSATSPVASGAASAAPPAEAAEAAEAPSAAPAELLLAAAQADAFEPVVEAQVESPAATPPAQPSGATSRFFGGLFAGSGAPAQVESPGAAGAASAGSEEAEQAGTPSTRSELDPTPSERSEAVADLGPPEQLPAPSSERPAESEGADLATAAVPVEAAGAEAKDKALVVPQRGGTARFLGRLLGYGAAPNQPLPLVYQWLEVKEIVRAVGRLAGATAASELCETCQAAAEGLRGVLPELAHEAPFIYVCGGSCGIAMDPTERFNLATGCWEALPSMNMPRRACAAASAGGRFYVMGGVDVPRFNASTFRESLQVPSGFEDRYRPECFDPMTNSWELLPPLNRPFTHASAAAIGGSIYVFGGLSFGAVLDQAQCYDPAKQRWECLQPMPTPRFECSAAPLRGKLYVVGGANIQGEPLAVAECFDPRTGQWKSLMPMFQARYGCAAAAARGRVHVFGGHGAWEDLADSEVYDPEVGIWTSLEPMCLRRNHCGAATARGRIYIFGGHAEGQDVNTVDCLDPETGEWEVAAFMSQPRSHCMTVAVMP